LFSSSNITRIFHFRNFENIAERKAEQSAIGQAIAYTLTL
jgi:hypothetical protein